MSPRYWARVTLLEIWLIFLEILSRHAAFAGVELGRDRVVAGLGEAPDHVLVLVGAAGETRDDDHDGVAAGRLGPGVVAGNRGAAGLELDVTRDEALAFGDDGLRRRDARGEHAPDGAHARLAERGHLPEVTLSVGPRRRATLAAAGRRRREARPRAY